MFQFPAFPTLARRQEISPGRFPDLGDLRIKARLTAPRSLSQLCHALRRLWIPRHPPYTLCSLTTHFVLRDVHVHSTTPCSQRTVLSRGQNMFVISSKLEWPSLWIPGPMSRDRIATSVMLVIQAREQVLSWWRRPDSNRRPPGCKPGALPTELRPRPFQPWCSLAEYTAE